MADVTNGIFSNYCYEKLWDLFKTPEDEVGSEFPGNKAGRSITNCIIYVSNVLIYAHDKINRPDISKKVNQLGKVEQDGTKLAKYLVNELNWKAHYWNPDVKNPRDGKPEHPVSYKKVLSAKTYYDIPISGLIVNYNKTDRSPERVWVPIPVPMIPIPIPIPISVSPDETAVFETFSKVKFAFGIARGGFHTFLVSNGEVFEVHWDQEGLKLYGKTPFKSYEWLSGALFTPIDSSFTSGEIK